MSKNNRLNRNNKKAKAKAKAKAKSRARRTSSKTKTKAPRHGAQETRHMSLAETAASYEEGTFCMVPVSKSQQLCGATGAFSLAMEIMALPETAHGNVAVSFDGWDDDPREIFEIPVIREFCNALLHVEPRRLWPYFIPDALANQGIFGSVSTLIATAYPEVARDGRRFGSGRSNELRTKIWQDAIEYPTTDDEKKADRQDWRDLTFSKESEIRQAWSKRTSPTDVVMLCDLRGEAGRSVSLGLGLPQKELSHAKMESIGKSIPCCVSVIKRNLASEIHKRLIGRPVKTLGPGAIPVLVVGRSGNLVAGMPLVPAM